jgi:hypothetical protein
VLVVALGVANIRGRHLLRNFNVRRCGPALKVDELAMLGTGGVAYGQLVSGSDKLAAEEAGNQQGWPNAGQPLPQPSRA